MALQKTYTSAQGFICPACYIVIDQTSFIKGEMAQGRLQGYKDKQARDDGNSSVFSWSFAFAYDHAQTEGIIEQAYMAVKNNPDYHDSIDV
jgi:hypothetical protein